MNLWRRASFALRSSLTWSLPAWRRPVALGELEAELAAPARRRLDALLVRHPEVRGWSGALSAPEWRESLYALDVLDRYLGPVPAGRGLDVGAKNGATLPGLVAAVPTGWDAVELDAHRRYVWGSTRRVYGESLAARTPDCRFISGDVRALGGRYAVITWFLPFLTPAPLEAWGLPDAQLAPESLLTHVLGLLSPGGVLLVLNQGEAEAARQAELFRGAKVDAEALGRIDAALSPFTRARFGFRVAGRPKA